MLALRNTAVRSVLRASRTATARTQVPVAIAVARQPAVARAGAVAAARWFTQSPRTANQEPDASSSSLDALQSASEASDVASPAAEQKDTSNGEETPYAVFIRNIVFDANEQHLKEAFEKFGTVHKTAIARDSRGLSKGFGFVWFSDQETCDKATLEANGSFWHGRRIAVQPRTARPEASINEERTPTKTLYIGNIPYETTDVELNRIFRDLEGVVDVRVAVDRTTGWPRGFAHADFKDIDSCVVARAKLNGQTLAGRQLRFDYAAQTPFNVKRKGQYLESPPM